MDQPGSLASWLALASAADEAAAALSRLASASHAETGIMPGLVEGMRAELHAVDEALTEEARRITETVTRLCGP